MLPSLFNAKSRDSSIPFLVLAPMDGVTDGIFRNLITGLFAGNSGIDLCVSEFVRVTDHCLPASVFYENCPELRSNGRTASGVPVFVQILGGQADAMAENGRFACELGALGIDINFGCPAATVNRHDGGASILKTPQRIETITKAVRNAVNPQIPVTVKVRIGWDSGSDMIDIARAAEQGGASWLTVHGRTRTQQYRPPVDWKSIRKARDSVAIPVIANGDILDESSLQACRDQSACEAFMIGRAAIASPEIFARLRRWTDRPWTMPEKIDLLLDYADRLQSAKGHSRHTLGRIKQWLRLSAPFGETWQALFTTVKRADTLESAVNELQRVKRDNFREHRLKYKPSLV